LAYSRFGLNNRLYDADRRSKLWRAKRHVSKAGGQYVYLKEAYNS